MELWLLNDIPCVEHDEVVRCVKYDLYQMIYRGFDSISSEKGNYCVNKRTLDENPHFTLLLMGIFHI